MGRNTLLFTDLVDSTALVARIGDARAAELWTEHDRQARRLLAQRDGLEIDRSDGFFLLFHHPRDAAHFALDYHRLVDTLGLSARIGIHFGPVTLRHNLPAEVERGAKPLEVEGLAKPVAARIMTLATGGHTLLSAAAARAVAAAPPDGQVLRGLGHYRFKGIEEPVEVFELAAPLASCTPPADGDKAYRVVLVGELWQPVAGIRHNLVPERDAFVGRQAELRHLAEQFEAGTRLLTVLGPGGTGKTRLVRRYAMAWLGEWPGGVYFCDLSEARSLEGIHFAVALALGMPLGKGDAGVQLGHAIAGRGRSLVILDNFEQVQPHAQATVGPWLDRAVQARFVVTSRERLQLGGEVVFALDPLALADDAIALFAARARAQQQDFVVDDGNRASVAEIVRLLDGLPLAIELAATRVRVLSPAQIVLRMKDRFALLTGASGASGVAARQATLRAAIDWSWELLAPWEQAALAQCSVFEGGFTLEAAEAVLALHNWPEAPTALGVIQSLVDKSLLHAWLPKAVARLGIAEPYFGMYLSIHEYARQKLQASTDQAAEAAEQRHLRYFAQFGSDQALDALLRHGAIAKRQTLVLELDNLVAACRRTIQTGPPELAAACFLAAWPVFEAQGPFKLAAALGLQLAGLDTLAPHQGALVRIAIALALRTDGQIEASNVVLAQALAVARQAPDRRAEAIALRHLAMAHHHDGRTDEAMRCFDAALALHETLTDRPQLGMLRANVANLQMELGQMTEARSSYEAALALHREVGNRAAEGIALGNLATLHFELGDLEQARAGYDAALDIHREAGSLLQEAITLCNLGILVSQQGHRREAAAHYSAALTIHRETGNRRGEGVVLAQIAELHQALGEFDQAHRDHDAALLIHREVGNRRFEGGTLANLGELLSTQGQFERGLRLLQAGEDALRALDDPLDLAKVLCAKGRVAFAGGHADTARQALAEAQAIAARLGANPVSDLGRQIASLRGALQAAA
jgi:predicted ATPase/class 3 adenylate cyclase/Tfp pilus assembly protein PilF